MARYDVSVDGVAHAVSTETGGGVSVDGEGVRVEVEEIAPHRFRVFLGGKPFLLLVERTGAGYRVVHKGQTHDVSVESERQKLARTIADASQARKGRVEIAAPLPALVRKIEVAVGDAVSPGTGLFILEAMKMENEIRADRQGCVKEICVAEGTTVEKGQLLLVLED